jgi:DNA helicase HerA-like ATPase
VSIPADRRDLHTYIVGATGTGKSTLLLNMIKQDMDNGEGVGVIDPHGDLISDVLPRIPEHRIDDVVLFDPADIEYPIGLNLLSASNFRETDLVCSDLLAVLERMFDAASWGDTCGCAYYPSWKPKATL